MKAKQKLREIIKNQVKKVLKEIEHTSNIKENSTNLNRDELKQWLLRYFTSVKDSESFDGEKGGIWVNGEQKAPFRGKNIFDYYNINKSTMYSNGTLKAFEELLNKRGWYSHFYDPGTPSIWPK